MQYPACKPATKWTLAALSLVLVSLLLLHQLLPIGFTAKSLHIPSLKDSAEKCLTTLETPRIPNIVHFVHLVKPSPNPSFEFPFRQFTAIYSAWHYLRPDVIYIHTNVEEHLIEETVKRTTNPYTRAVSKLPGVKFSHHTAPDQTTSGVPIDKLPNQSDFVRTDILDKLGGIYLDDDSYVLRDLEPLSRIHFENIVGKQVNGQICPAVIMSTPGNKLMKAYHALQDSVFDPHFWAHHATDLLTTLAQDFQKPDHQVLILPQDTFFPFAWFPEDLKMMYQVHDDAGTPAVNNVNVQNLTSFIENFELYPPKTWQRDWRSSYVLHGWTSGIEKQLTEGERIAMFGEFGDITLEYVLARNSNFARAVYPAVRHALDNGFLENAQV